MPTPEPTTTPAQRADTPAEGLDRIREAVARLKAANAGLTLNGIEELEEALSECVGEEA